MTAKEILTKFEETSSLWKKALRTYSITQLTTKPSEDSWSIGQVYIHILSSALKFHGKQVEICLHSSENSNGVTQPFALAMLDKGEMPSEPIHVPPSPQYTPQQPESVEQIELLFAQVNDMMKSLAEELDEAVEAGKILGKTLHPRMGFLGAMDWYHIIAMHFQHHLHQKGRIDAFLKQQVIT